MLEQNQDDVRVAMACPIEQHSKCVHSVYWMVDLSTVNILRKLVLFATTNSSSNRSSNLNEAVEIMGYMRKGSTKDVNQSVKEMIPLTIGGSM